MNDEKKPMDKALDTFVKSLQEENKKDKSKQKVVNRQKSNDTNTQKDNVNNIDDLIEFVKKILEQAAETDDVDVKYDEEALSISVYGRDLGIMIGREGRNIAALEHIVNMVGKRKRILSRNVVLDIKDYRKKNIEKVRKIAKKMAKKAVQEGRKIALRPMPSYERKMIHNSLSSMKNVRTASKDIEPNRRVIIYPITEEQ